MELVLAAAPDSALFRTHRRSRMSGESYTRWHNQPSDDEEDEAGGDGGGGARVSGGGGVTIVTSPSHHHHHHHLQHHQELTGAARARLLCVMVLVCLTCLSTGVLLGYYAGAAAGRGQEFILDEAAKEEEEVPPAEVLPSGDAIEEEEEEEEEMDVSASVLLQELKPDMIKGYMRQLKQTPKTLLADYLESTWKAQGLQTSRTSFTVNLSKPDPEQPNTVEVTYTDGHRELLNRLPQGLRSSPFLAFSAAGLVTGTVVYGHYGRREDLVKLQALKIPLKGAILLLRHGKIHDGSKVHNAEQAGAAGVLLYPDPQDFAGVNGLFPNGTGLPSDGVMWNTLNTVPGDPATPFLPSLYHIYKAPGASKTLPGIPAQTLSSETAGRVQELMGGPGVPEGWQGGLDTFYRVGGAWINGTGVVNVTLSVSNIVYQETLANVHATLPAQDNTKFLMLGCHYGSLYTESAAGMAGLLAISEAVGKAFPSGTQRKIIFSAWAAGEYGMIGSTEFAQLYSSWVDSSMLAYLSLDEMLQGTGSLRVSASPLLHEALRKAATKVAWPVGEAVSVRDGWRLQEPISNADVHFGSLASGSDYVSFAAQHGVPAAHFQVMGKEWKVTYDLRHTQYDTPAAYTSVLDPEYKWTYMLASLVGVTALVLSESHLPPVDFRELSGSLYNGWQMFLDAHSSALNNSGYDFSGVLGAILKEIEVMESTMTYLTEWYRDGPPPPPTSQYEEKDTRVGGSCGDFALSLKDFRQIEERLQRVMSVKRGLLGPRGIGRTFTTHLMVGPDPEDPLEPSQYPHAARAITLALAQKTPWESVHQELSYILSALTSFRELFVSEAVPETYPII